MQLEKQLYHLLCRSAYVPKNELFNIFTFNIQLLQTVLYLSH